MKDKTKVLIKIAGNFCVSVSYYKVAVSNSCLLNVDVLKIVALWINIHYTLYIFFWVFPRRQIVFCQRFGTLCQVHLQRLDVDYEV
jgi:hypothetical protein